MGDLLLLYVWTRLDSVNLWSGLALLVVAAVGAMLGFVRITEDDEVYDRHLRRCGWALAILLAVQLSVPTKRDMAIIVGGKFAIEAARSPEAKEIGSAVRDLVMRELRAAAEKE